MSVQSISLTPANTRNTKNNQLRMTFPFPFNSLGNEICLSNLYIYYSWRNITSFYGNNSVSYIWNGTTFSFIIPDGFYTISDISGYLQQQMFNNGHYTLDSNGNPFYYIELAVNSVYYSVTLTCRPISLPSGGSNPVGVTLSGNTPQLSITNSRFGTLIGFSTGTYPNVVQATTYQVNSTLVPQISPVTSINVNCSFVNNGILNIVAPRSIYSFSPNEAYSSQINISPQQLLWYRVIDQNYSEIEVFFTDQNGNDLQVLDTNIVCNLLIRPIVK